MVLGRKDCCIFFWRKIYKNFLENFYTGEEKVNIKDRLKTVKKKECNERCYKKEEKEEKLKERRKLSGEGIKFEEKKRVLIREGKNF